MRQCPGLVWALSNPQGPNRKAVWETAAARRLLRRAPGREAPEMVPKAEAHPQQGRGGWSPSPPLPAASALGVPGDRAAPTPALAGSQHHRESDERRCGMFRCPHPSPLRSGRVSAREPSLSTEATAERKPSQGRRPAWRWPRQQVRAPRDGRASRLCTPELQSSG